MNYLRQAAILAAVTVAAELMKYFLPLPVPASIYGLLLLFLLLKTGALKLEQVEDVGNLLLELMPLLLVPASVSVLADMETVRSMLLPLLLAGFAGTMLVMLAAGRTAQWIMGSRKGGRRK